jgi:hypothetical protein
MVAAGVGDSVDITLYVIAEGRYAMPELPEVSVYFDQLEWNWTSSTSNYLTLRADALAQNGARSYLTSFARERAFSEAIVRPDGLTATYNTTGGSFGGYSTFDTLYFAQAATDDGTADACSALLRPYTDSETVVENCSDLGGPCDTLPSGQLSSRDFECGGYTDVAAALIGMQPTATWITRLEMTLPKTALDHDCVVDLAASQKTVESWYRASRSVNAPCHPSPWTGSVRPLEPGEGRTASLGLAALAALALVRRARRTRA